MTEREKLVFGPPDPVLEEARSFIRTFWSDADGEDEVRADLRRAARRSVVDGLTALRNVLDDPSNGWTLTYLVEVDANHSLDECTDAAARAWLERFVAMAESVLASGPPLPGGVQPRADDTV